MKITIHKRVFWTAAGRRMEGKVKQILSDHAIVAADGSDYLVHKDALSAVPATKIASTAKTIITTSNTDI